MECKWNTDICMVFIRILLRHLNNARGWAAYTANGSHVTLIFCFHSWVSPGQLNNSGIRAIDNIIIVVYYCQLHIWTLLLMVEPGFRFSSYFTSDLQLKYDRRHERASFVDFTIWWRPIQLVHMNQYWYITVHVSELIKHYVM